MACFKRCFEANRRNGAPYTCAASPHSTSNIACSYDVAWQGVEGLLMKRLNLLIYLFMLLREAEAGRLGERSDVPVFCKTYLLV